MNKQKLRELGIDVDSALERLGGNAALFERLLQAFLVDPNYGELLKALEDIFGNDFKSKPIYDERMSRFFISKSEHCKGLYDALKSGR